MRNIATRLLGTTTLMAMAALAACSPAQQANNAISGDAVMRTRGGEPRTCAGFPVLLIPKSRAADAWAKTVFGNAEAGYSPQAFDHEAPRPPASAATTQTMCDAQGKFSFDGLADGTYYVVTEVSWDVQYERQGGLLMRAVTLSEGKPEHVFLSDAGLVPHRVMPASTPTQIPAPVKDAGTGGLGSTSARGNGGDQEAQRKATDTKSLQRRWGQLETECRGGPHTPDDAVCTERDRVTAELERRGVCWAYSDWRVYPSDYKWHPCSEAHPKGWRPGPEFDDNSR